MMTSRVHTPEDVKKIQRQWVGLTDEQIDAAWMTVAWHSSKGLKELRREYARAVLAKSKELNT